MKKIIIAALFAIATLVAITATVNAQCPNGQCGYSYGSYYAQQPYYYGCQNGQCGSVAYGVKNAVATTASVVDRAVKKTAVTAVVTAKKAVEAPKKAVAAAATTPRRVCTSSGCYYYSTCYGGQCGGQYVVQGVKPCAGVETTEPQPEPQAEPQAEIQPEPQAEPQPCASVQYAPQPCEAVSNCYGGNCYSSCDGGSCGGYGFGWRIGRLFGWR